MMVNKFLTPLVALALLSQPTFAESTFTVEGITPFKVEATVGDKQGCPYALHVTNGQQRAIGTPDNYNETVVVDGVEFGVAIEMFINPAPDRVTITPPEPFVAFPSEFDIGEDETFTFQICNPAEMLMG